MALGRGELRQGRTLDSLQAAYRVGARVAWRRIAAAGRGAGLDAEALSLLAEAIFAYIDELSADSVEGYAQAQSEVRGRAPPPPPRAGVAAGARAAGRAGRRARRRAGGRWAVPRRLAAASPARRSDLGRVAGACPPDASPRSLDGAGCVLVPDPDGPGRARAERAAAAAARWRSARPASAPSWRRHGRWRGRPRRRRRRRAAARRRCCAPRSTSPTCCSSRAAAWRRGSPRGDWRRCGGLTDGRGERMRETALAYVRQQGNAVAMAGRCTSIPRPPATGWRGCASCSATRWTTRTPGSSSRLALRAGGRVSGASGAFARQRAEDDVPERRGDAVAVAVVLEVVAHVLLAQPLAELRLRHEVVHVVVRVVVGRGSRA